MKLTISHQEYFSRGELLLRTFFGYLYIMVPHGFLLFFFSIWSSILTFISFWSIIFNGRYPQSFYEFQVGLLRWDVRVRARMYNLADDYPAFGINGTDEHTVFEVDYPESLDRVQAIIKVLFGWIYVIIPHGFILFFRIFWTSVLSFVAFWVVLFTGKYPAHWHEFNTGTIRWIMRVSLYMSLMTDEYPPFSGKE